MVFANVEDFLYVRKEPDEDSEWLGKLYKGGAATAVGTEGDYTLIRSGSVEGYVLKMCIRDRDSFDRGDYHKAVEQENLAKTIVEVLYPNEDVYKRQV